MCKEQQKRITVPKKVRTWQVHFITFDNQMKGQSTHRHQKKPKTSGASWPGSFCPARPATVEIGQGLWCLCTYFFLEPCGRIRLSQLKLEASSWHFFSLSRGNALAVKSASGEGKAFTNDLKSKKSLFIFVLFGDLTRHGRCKGEQPPAQRTRFHHVSPQIARPSTKTETFWNPRKKRNMFLASNWLHILCLLGIAAGR